MKKSIKHKSQSYQISKFISKTNLRLNVVLLIIFLIPSHIYSQNWNKYSVLFGERSKKINNSNDNVIRIFLDKEGYIYPNLFIKDKKIKKNKSSLKTYFYNNDRIINQLANSYQIDSNLDKLQKIQSLNKKLAESYIKKINSIKDQYDNIYFLIHGYRKKAYGKAQYLSVSDNLYQRQDISQNGKENLFIEIYWDSKHLTPLQAFKYKGFRVMEESAIPNAINVGNSLRRILPYIEIDTLNIVAHSLGAIVTSQLLFNSEESNLLTPNQKTVNVCLMAPAVGSEYFSNYYNRNSTVDFKNNDNYNLNVIYNENDFVLNKTFNWRFITVNVEPTRYGNTSLGCNYNDDVDNLKNMFIERFKGSNIPNFVQINTTSSGEPMRCHLVDCYSSNKKFLNLPMFN